MAAAAAGPATSAVEYAYDGAGNITELRQIALSPAGITDFQPRSGAFGDLVVLTGQGFDSTVTRSQAQLGGVAMEVVSASPTSLAVRVPFGARSGRIFLSSPGTTMATASDFLVSQTMTIADFSPKVGVAGTAVSIAGAGFDPNPIGNVVEFAGARASVQTASPSSLGVTAPTGARSGPVRLTTRWGTATTAADFVIAPPGVNAGAVTVSGRMVLGTPRTYTSTATGTSALFVFDGVQGQSVNFAVTANSLTGWTSFSVYDPSGAQLFTSSSYAGVATKSLVGTLPSTGTYTLAVAPAATATGAATLLLVANVTGALPTDGAAVSVALSPGQDGYFTFPALAGQAFTMRSTCPAAFAGSAIVRAPGGSTAKAFVPCTPDLDAKSDLGPLAQAGTHVLAILPSGVSAGAVDLRLLSYAIGTLSTSAPALAWTLGPAQNGQFSFPGTAGETLAVGVSPLSTTPAGQYVSLLVMKPDGTTLSSAYGTAATVLSLPALPISGTYSLKISPVGTAAAAGAAIVSAPLTGTLVANAATTFSSSRPGQIGRYTFSATAGQSLTLRATGTSTFSGTVYVYSPAGTIVANGSLSTTSADIKLDLGTVATAGTYRVEVVPAGLATGSVVLTLLPYASGALAVDGPGQGWAVTAAQNALLTFTGNAGAILSAALSPLTTTPANQYVSFQILKPDGSVLTSSYGNTATVLSLPALPVAGTYSIKINLNGTGAASGTVFVSAPLTGALVAGGTTTFSSSRPGQRGRYTFTGAVGQSFTVQATCHATFNGVVGAYTPSGSQIGNISLSAGAPDAKLDLKSLTSSGTHLVEIRPNGLATGTVALQLLPYVTNSLVIGGPARALDLGAGQNASLTFTGSAGDLLSLGATALGTTPVGGYVAFSVLRPDGTTLASTNAKSPFSFSVPSLPVAGTYTVKMVPPGTLASSATVQLTRR